MSEHTCSVRWSRGDHEYTYDTFSRDHIWRFPGGVEVPASSAPDFLGNPDNVNPEEGLVAIVSGCHMLTFLAVAARRRLVVERYDDDPVGTLEKNADGKLAVTRVVLRPRVTWGGDGAPDAAALDKLHQQAHANCIVANSVKSEVVIEPVS